MNSCTSESRCIHGVSFDTKCPYCSYEHSPSYTEKTTMAAPDENPDATDGTALTKTKEIIHEAYMAGEQVREKTPDGIEQHEKGAKLDAGKPRISLVLGGFPRALWAVCEVGTAGAAKYTDNGWMEVRGGMERYSDAGLRHFLKEAMGEEVDPDFDLLHMAHEAWNSLAKLELKLRELEKANEKNNCNKDAAYSCASRATAGNN